MSYCRLRFRRHAGTFAALVGFAAMLSTLELDAETPATLFRTDLSRCEPSTALSERFEPDAWRLLPYTTGEGSGTLIHAPSFSTAPDVTLPLDATGWHRVYVGIWQPTFAYDGETVLRVKLTGDTAFRRIHPPKSADTQTDTYIREIFLRAADLTGQDLVVGKMRGLKGRNASLAYVKLEPLSPEEVARVEADRAQSETRNLVATIDGMSYFHYGEYSQPADVLDLVEPYRHSDVAKVLWAVTYGDRTAFPTKTPDATFLGKHNRSAQSIEDGVNEYIRGEQQVHRALRDFAAQGALPHVLAARHAQTMGIEFDLMIRLGILGGLGFLDLPEDGFLKANPDCRQVLADGAIIDKASFAFEETQDFTIALIREVLSGSNADGINLCFVRGPQFLQFEAPVVDAFQREYGEDARSVPADDPRLATVRTQFMTRFVEKVHLALADIGTTRGRPVNLSVWVWPGAQSVWLGGTPAAEGLDVAGWIQKGWLDSVICQEGVDSDYLALGKAHGCDFVLFTGYRGDKAMSPATVTAAYAEGVEQFAYWDIDAVQILPYHWNWLRRIGHREEMADWDSYQPKDRLVRLKSVAGIDVDRGLRDAVYSGG